MCNREIRLRLQFTTNVYVRMVSEIVPGVEKKGAFYESQLRGVGGVFVTIRENFNISLRGFFKLIFRLLGEFPAIIIRDLTNELIMGWRRRG